MAIEVRDISKSFGTTPVLEDINLDVKSGALTALLGPSGGGKSTLLRIIAGLETPDVGTVSILGQESTYLPPQRRNVGFVFQHYAAFKHLSVFRNVAFGLEVRKKGKDEIRTRVMELLELVHLDQFAERLPSQLSGGQRQRMALARALAVEPDVLLLDEPFGALDAQVRKELRAWLRRLHDEVHVTTVFVTHDQEEAIEISDDVVVLAGGKIVQSGAPAALYDHPKDEFVMRFLGPVTQLGGQLVRPHDLELSLDPAGDAVPAVVRRIVKLGFEVRVDLQEQGGQEMSAQLTRASSAQLDLAPGREVYVRLTAGARSLQLAG
jgi:sulfate/thiosulfate transport system ATP-binding protein